MGDREGPMKDLPTNRQMRRSIRRRRPERGRLPDARIMFVQATNQRALIEGQGKVFRNVIDDDGMWV